MPALRLRVKLAKEPPKPETVVSPEPQQGLFRRILHRAVSKTNLRSASHAPPSPQPPSDADITPQRRNGRGDAPPPPRPKRSFPRLRSQPDQHHGGKAEIPNQRPSEAYVPRHAASDFSRTACSRDGSTRFHSFDEGRRRAVLDSPPTERPGTSPGLLLVTSQHPDKPSRSPPAQTSKPLEVAGPQEDEQRCRVAPLQPSTIAPTKRHATRHSYKLAVDPFEAPPELSDYQKFIQKAIEDDRQHREELWRTVSQQSSRGRDALVLNHPDLHMSHPVETSRRERRGSTGGKRSILSYRSHADRQEKRNPGPEKQVGKRTSNRSLRHKTSMTERLHDYFKPHATGHDGR